MTPLRWAIVGTGFISNTIVEAISASPGSTIAAVAGRTQTSLADFADRHEIEWRTTDVAALVQSPDIDVVYVGTPNHAHHLVVTQAVGAGKPTLSEKSLTRTMDTAHELVNAVRASGTLFVEGLMYLAHPMYTRLLERLASGEFGELRSVTGWYHADIHSVANPAGGGTLYNLGCYPVSLLHLVVQAMCGPSVFEDRTLTAVGTRMSADGHEVMVDAAASVRFGNGVMATLQSSDTHGMDHGFVVVTAAGTLRWETNPWLPVAGTNLLTWEPHEGSVETIELADTHDAFFHQIQMMERLIAAGSTQADRPSPLLADSLQIMQFLADWEAAV